MVVRLMHHASEPVAGKLVGHRQTFTNTRAHLHFSNPDPECTSCVESRGPEMCQNMCPSAAQPLGG
ncbi:hypothetical protein BDY19DRAFT_932205 [Irpex rosettiformis]|uniref:Uncharacterized protein n=1 Tax=Irpex rosettiformis TaxID=378272 RepID=A0ACB8UCT9_9APHY|nr:hypothetical protein BDY19DRAFT_932205 [Irpex rosettiformis]